MVRICYTLRIMLKPPAPPHDEPASPVAHGAPLHYAQALRPINSEALFRGAAEVQIEHRGSLYRLRQTSLGKLILTK
jgi:hemin uptake protein HemP